MATIEKARYFVSSRDGINYFVSFDARIHTVLHPSQSDHKVTNFSNTVPFFPLEIKLSHQENEKLHQMSITISHLLCISFSQ